MKSNAKNWVLWFVAAAVLANVAWAGDVWKDKKPADWSQKDMEKFLTRSPWARTVQPATAPQSIDRGPTSANTGGWSGGPGGGGGGGGWHGNGGDSAMPITTFQVRWVSAPIMREALKIYESDPLNAAIARYSNDFYIVSVTMQTKGGGGGGRGGTWGGGGRWGAPGGGQGGATQAQQDESRKRFEAMLIQGAVLRFGRHAIHPAQAQMVPGKDGMTTLYLFPRTLQLEDASKDFVFEFTQGPAVTQADFSLKGFEQAPEKGL